MKTRNIERIIAPANYNWVGDAFYTTSFVGQSTGITRRRMDPFIGIGYNSPINFPPRAVPRGVGAHPHKGFETVTLAYQGKIAHHDSKGNYGIISEGDAQWMTAGAGILHSEYHEKEWSQQGGIFQMVQLWVNLPAKDKLTTAHYQDMIHDSIPKVILDNNSGVVDVIAGNFNGQNGKAKTYTPIHVYNIRLNKDGLVSLDLPNNYNTAFITIQGSVSVNGKQVVPTDNFAMLENNKGTVFAIKALEEHTIILLLSGKPLDEPLVMHGPFVMNTEEQIKEAFTEFKEGKFGII